MKVQESWLKWHVSSFEKRKRICEQESDRDGGAEKKKESEDRSGGGWITSRTTCRRENCQGRKHKTEFNGGVS